MWQNTSNRLIFTKVAVIGHNHYYIWPWDGWRLDIGYPEDLLAINRKYLNDDTHEINGNIKDSNIKGPVYISPDCEIINSNIGPYTMIEKGVTIKNSEIRQFIGNRLKNSVYRNLYQEIINTSNKYQKDLLFFT